MQEFESPGLVKYNIQYYIDDLDFDCQLNRVTEKVMPALQHLFAPERDDFITLKAELFGDFIQIFFNDNNQITSLSSRCRIEIQELAIPKITDAKMEKFVFDKYFQGNFIFRGNPHKGIVEILLGVVAPQTELFRYAENIAFGVENGKVKKILFSDVEFIQN